MAKALKKKPEGVKPKKAIPVDKALLRYREIAEKRFKMAMQIYEAQDGSTQEVIDRIRDRLTIAATGVVIINGQPVKLEQKYVDFNLLWIAVDILSDLAMMNIQIENYEPSPMVCIECKREIYKQPESKRKRR